MTRLTLTGAGGGPHPFVNPSSISGCLQFVEMDRGVEESDGSTPENGENIQDWKDEWSGSDRDFTQPTVDLQPVYNTSFFDVAGAVFDGSNDNLYDRVNDEMNFDYDDNFYLIVAFKTGASMLSWQGLYTKQLNADAENTYAGWFFHIASNTKLSMQIRQDYQNSRSINVNSDTTTLAINTFYIVEMQYTKPASGFPLTSGATSYFQLFVNEAAQTLSDASAGDITGSVTSTADVMLGGRGISGTSVGGASNCIFAAAGCYSGILTTDNRSDLFTYLNDKYNP